MSHTVKQVYPDARVVFNDYDNFSKRLKAIPETNKLLNSIREIVGTDGSKNVILDGKREQILKVIQQADRKGFVDYISLSSNILFSMNYVTSYKELIKQRFYDKLRKSPYDATGYLDGVEVVCDDYKSLFNQYKDYSNSVFLVDPPYLSTDTKTYNSDQYWKLRDYLDVLNTITGENYVYFTSNKSHIVELMNWIESRTFKGNPFEGSEVVKMNASTTHNSGYTDIMVYKYYEE